MGNIIEIRDFDAKELDIYARLTEAQLLNKDRPEDGLFIAESPKVILRALDAGYEPVSVLAEDRCAEREAEEIIRRYPDIPVYTAPFDVLTQLTGYKLTRGLLCVMRRKRLPKVSGLCRGARRIAVLENVMNPTNVGAIIRSAAALNMDAVLFTPGCSNPLYRRAIRVSMGTVFQIPWTFLAEEEAGVWPEKGMEYLKSLGYRTAAMALHDESVDIDDRRLREEEKLAVILGTEGDGLSDKTIHMADYTIKIPMSHGVDSLNVAAASAVAFWELRRR
ncbi:RNA methyltransferase [Ruminococcus sp. CLA-AA-H200]|uniref:RNA methyltransferase n=1 Tax=Ruminococcus turbiniformis TaxID=2881258 RepID=A0ABS8FZ83_9FIRM|nr:RNA methyltransferase [Ruminococcus turbiniformis]MCC2255272.1 RNA methyltransferase [Ruminococcus turbiniformis]